MNDMNGQRTGKSRGRKKGGSYITVLMVFLVIMAALFLYKNIFRENGVVPDTKTDLLSGTASSEPPFLKEGELHFLHKRDRTAITTVAVEIADNDYEREKGLMYRHSLPASAGMLFIFDQPKVLSFWMRNTYIPLDIIFADEDKQIVTIQKNAEPLSYGLISSHRNAKYVVEVNGGFSDKFAIGVGDYIAFSKAVSRGINASGRK